MADFYRKTYEAETITDYRRYVKRTPIISNDVIAPSVMSAIAISFAMFALTWLIFRWFYPDVTGFDRIAIAFMGGMAAGGFGFVAVLNNRLSHYEDMLWAEQETVIPNDAAPPATTPAPVRNFIQVGRSSVLMPNEPKPGALIDLSKALNGGASFSLRTAEEFGYSRERFNELRDHCIKNGWVVWNNADEPRQGMTVTNAGKAVFRSVANSPRPDGS
jgi:hypothetical protein